jgi:redox-sensitive bicupin YhaK (pirin superfamily)
VEQSIPRRPGWTRSRAVKLKGEEIHDVHPAPSLASSSPYPGGRWRLRRPPPLPAPACRSTAFSLLDDGTGGVRAGQAVGAPGPPHRGFETVTYALEGDFEHEDSAGHRGRIGPGDVQWMTAGAGVVHSRCRPPESARRAAGSTASRSG